MLRKLINRHHTRLPQARYISPPSHFNNPRAFPEPYTNQTPVQHELTSEQSSPSQYSPESSTPQYSPDPSSSESHSSFRDFASLIAMSALAYLALDSYTTRVKQEKAMKEITVVNLKNLQVQRASFLNASKQKDLQVLSERREQSKRNFKMSLHIAMLRKQLLDLGVDPVDIDVVTKEFEDNVRADYSSKNVSGQALWLNDGSNLKSYFPDPHDYDKKQNPAGIKD